MYPTPPLPSIVFSPVYFSFSKTLNHSLKSYYLCLEYSLYHPHPQLLRDYLLPIFLGFIFFMLFLTTATNIPLSQTHIHIAYFLFGVFVFYIHSRQLKIILCLFLHFYSLFPTKMLTPWGVESIPDLLKKSWLFPYFILSTFQRV